MRPNDADRGVRVKASFVARELSEARLCKQLGSFQPASEYKTSDFTETDEMVLFLAS